jgi:lipopolysaccharide/colanic/teichoic acid biosynthesis glycosyltransferase
MSIMLSSPLEGAGASATPTLVRALPPRRDDRTRSLPWARCGKRIFDLLAAACLLCLLMPLLVFLAVTSRVLMGPGIFYRQTRVGRDGLPFDVLKFRTLHPDRRHHQLPLPGADRRVNHKSADDPRHTAFGRMLRRWSLDELPQLYNVLRGDMSLVGPRPELLHLVATYEDWEHDRHLVRPGLTGLWQVTARGNGTPMREHSRLDVEYARSVSLKTDARILLRTFRAIGTGS